MQDNDFDNIFSHKFGQLPGQPYDEENWSELTRRMDAHGQRRMRWLLPVLFSLLGLLGLSNIFWWYQWREANQKQERSANAAVLLQNDTIIRKTIVYHYDTIYQNVTLVQRQSAGTLTQISATASSNSFSAGNFSANNIFSTHTNPFSPNPGFIESPATSIAQDAVKQQFANGGAAAPAHTIVHKTPMDTAEQATPPLPFETAATDTLFENLLEKQPLPTKKAQSPFLYFARPRMGGTAVLGFPSFPHKSSGSLWGAGIRADVEIARNFRLGAEIDYLQASLKADDTQALESIDIDIPDPGGDFSLKYWETYFLPSFTYALHLRYEIPLRGNWTPWIGVGGQAITTLPFEVEYEFENEVNNIELHVPAKAESSTYVQGILFMLGAECRLNPHLYFGAEGYMLRSLGEEEEDHEEEGQGLLDDQLGLKTSIIYKF